LEKTEVRASPLVRHRIRVLLKPPWKSRACINQEKIIRMIRPATIRTKWTISLRAASEHESGAEEDDGAVAHTVVRDGEAIVFAAGRRRRAAGRRR
jgi:hypothetical protein